MFSAALMSAFSACPHALQTKCSWSLRLFLSTYPHFDARGISRVDINHQNPRRSCFVLNELAQLIKRPRRQSFSHCLTNRFPRAFLCSFANSFEVFKNNGAAGALCLQSFTQSEITSPNIFNLSSGIKFTVRSCSDFGNA